MKPSLFLLTAALAGCGGADVDGLRLEDDRVVVEADEEAGVVTIRSRVDAVEVRGLHLAVEVEQAGRARMYTTRGKPMACGIDGEALVCEADTQRGFAAELRVSLVPGVPGAVSWEASFVNTGQAPAIVRKLYPFRMSAEDGGAFVLGGDPAGVRILQNGNDEMIDYYVDLIPGDTPLSDPEADPLFVERSSYSNGSALVHDPGSGESLLAGFVELPWATPLVAVAGSETGLTHLHAEARYPRPVPVPAGGNVSLGSAVFLVGASDPFGALEAYADIIVRALSIELPRYPASGWDSWYTSFANTDIDEAFILENAEALARLFSDYGLDSMQVDMGWHARWGDWVGHDGFPSGMQAVASGIDAQGLMPELWIAPLSAEESSAVWQNHGEDWFLPKSLWGQVLMAPDMHPFDLSKPEVMEHVRSLARRVRDWGYRSVKMDFAYYVLQSLPPPDPEATPTALYRDAVRAFREELGPDVQFINIAMCFPNYGLVDAFRLGLDDWPCWDGGSDCQGYVTTGGKGSQGLKPVVRMAARRYWMNGRLWWSHLDQVYFRELTDDEIRAFVSLVGLAGGMVSLGEDARSLTPGDADPYRRILPLTGHTARPLDLFAREFPEVWHLPIGDAHLVGLFHWGQNLDLGFSPYAARPDGGQVTHAVDLTTLGLDDGKTYLAYEFWTGEVTTIEGTIEAELAPHTARVFRLVPEPEVPVYLGTNRHLLMGPSVIEDLSYDPDRGSLTGFVHVVAGFEHTLAFWVPEGTTLSSASLEGVSDLTPSMDGARVLRLSFGGNQTDRWPLVLDFER